MNDNPSDIGEAMLRLQAHIHAIGAGPNYRVMNNAYFTQAIRVAEELVGRWLLHPTGREWDLIRGIENFIECWPADKQLGVDK